MYSPEILLQYFIILLSHNIFLCGRECTLLGVETEGEEKVGGK
jgi:hypothetical protein